MKLEKNDIVEGIIDNLGNSGEGILRVENFPVFVDFALPNEKVRVKVLKVNETHGFGKLIEIIEPSDFRQEPPCPYYYSCGGCQLQHMNYKSQKDFKKQRVIDCFERIGGFKNIEVNDTIGPKEPYFYRNKVQLPVGRKNGKVELGFYKPRTHTITDIDGCLIQMDVFNELMKTLRQWIKENNIPVFDEEKQMGKNELRHLLLRSSKDQKKVMVVPIFTSPSKGYMEKLVELLNNDSRVVSIVENINDRKSNTILGNKNTTYYGKDTITDYIGDLSFEISPHSFFQVNPPMTEAIYNEVINLSDFKENEIVFDLYCGAGTISLFIANKVKKVYGIEIVPQAIEDANKNKERDKIENVEFILGKAEEKIDDLINKNIKPDTVILDPPRKGCEPSLLSKIGELKPNKITYVSCNPATQARDIKILNQFGYNINIIQPVDNFPQTSHVEMLALLSKLDVDKHINVEIELDELDLTSAESKATYAQIKEYILEKFDLKVSTLYIAQIKRKCGIELREHYNKAKKENQIIPQCTPEKEEAIMDALRHLKMI